MTGALNTLAGTKLKHGDFTGLADDYSKYRPKYSETVLTALLSLLPSKENVRAADIGAGTGIWTRMLAERGANVTAVEPNDDMRAQGEAGNGNFKIQWMKGSAETNDLPANTFDLVSMASSFHWTNFDTATKNFHRILKSSGRFVALWNPRLIEVNPILVEIEAHLKRLVPELKRVSSGNSDFTSTLTEKLWASPYFTDVIYLEGRHSVQMSFEQYRGAWRSVNDIRVQAGEERFNAFMAFIEERTKDLPYIEATYLTRAWTARKK